MRALALAAVLFAASVQAAPAPRQVDAEIDHLLDALGRSGCQFQRNGSWHAAAEARSHLQRKRDYLKKRDAITSTEGFIAQAATRSSMSGKSYHVRCGDAPMQSSQAWLTNELRVYRAARN
jgi:hypothetical protein